MTVQIPDPGTGNGQTGDNEYVFRKKVKDNFSDRTNAASRLVGIAQGDVPAFDSSGSLSFGLGGYVGLPEFPDDFAGQKVCPTGFYYTRITSKTYGDGLCVHINRGYWFRSMYFPTGDNSIPKLVQGKQIGTAMQSNDFLIRGLNANPDSNGFFKTASPVVDMYDNKIGLNNDAEQQGSITFEKLGVGDYLVKGSLGFAQQGWYIETPKDANGNVLVAVVYKQLENNNLSIKTYAKRFDDETGDVVPNLTRPRDIPAGRFISLRLHELPKEPPVMPTESQPEV